MQQRGFFPLQNSDEGGRPLRVPHQVHRLRFEQQQRQPEHRLRRHIPAPEGGVCGEDDAASRAGTLPHQLVLGRGERHSRLAVPGPAA